jgi:heme exporter protein D
MTPVAGLGPHAVFILASYAITAVVFAGLIAWLIATGRRHQRTLDALHAQGVTRRSATTTQPAGPTA